jgi:hypothetical protein
MILGVPFGPVPGNSADVGNEVDVAWLCVIADVRVDAVRDEASFVVPVCDTDFATCDEVAV